MNQEEDGSPTFVAPGPISSYLEGFDQPQRTFTELEVSGGLGEASKGLKDMTAAEKHGAWAEALAFGLIESASGNDPWGTHFGPMASFVDNEGRTHYLPDVTSTDAGALNYWAGRAHAVKHPILKARYADLAWDMGPTLGVKPRNPDMARLAVDAYLASIPVRGELYDRLKAASRALELAALMNDKERIERARAALLALHGEAMSEKRLWMFAYDRLIKDRRAGLTDEERQSLIDDLESVVKRASCTAPRSFDPHDVKDAAERLIKHHERTKSTDQIKRLHAHVGHAFEHFGGLGSATLGSTVLQTAVQSYQSAGMTSDHDRARRSMENKIAQAGEETTAITTEFRITREDMDQFLAKIVVEELTQTIVNIAGTFLSNRRELEALVQQSMKESPVQAMIPMQITVGDRVVAKIGSVKDDPFGRLVYQAQMNLGLSEVWLSQVLAKTVADHSLTPEHIVAWANRLELYDDTTLLLQGVRAWFDKDYIKAIHVLVPQIERGLRRIVTDLGKPVTRAHRDVPGASLAINMGEILNDQDVVAALGSDLSLHFLALYADPRGRNLRNELVHGLLSASSMTAANTQWLIHTLFLFGAWKELAQKRR